jgi:hypothetical protein
MMPCENRYSYKLSGKTCCLQTPKFSYLTDGSNCFFQNAGKTPSDYTASHNNNNNNNNNKLCKLTILWNQQIKTDRAIPNNKPDIVIRDYEKGTCMWIDVAIPGDRTVIQKEAEKILK